MTFTKIKHYEAKELFKDTILLFSIFWFMTLSAAITYGMGLYTVSIGLGLGGSLLGVLTIMLWVGYHSRVNRELQCKIAGVNFNDFCTCKFHRKLKEEKEKGQSKLE